MESKDLEGRILQGLKKAGVPNAERHLFVCIGPDCCRGEMGEPLWEHIKQRIRETGAAAMRTKAACLRVCSGGPWVVVYPEGVWYGAVTFERFDRILDEHLIGGKEIAEWVVAKNGVGCDGCLEG